MYFYVICLIKFEKSLLNLTVSKSGDFNAILLKLFLNFESSSIFEVIFKALFKRSSLFLPIKSSSLVFNGTEKPIPASKGSCSPSNSFMVCL